MAVEESEYGGEERLWRRRAAMEEKSGYGGEEWLWRRRAAMEEKSGYRGEEGLWRRRAAMENVETIRPGDGRSMNLKKPRRLLPMSIAKPAVDSFSRHSCKMILYTFDKHSRMD